MKLHIIKSSKTKENEIFFELKQKIKSREIDDKKLALIMLIKSQILVYLYIPL